MQLQYLSSFSIDADIQKSLGRLPPDLETIYAELCGVLSNKPGKFKIIVFRNVLSWLLCAQRTLKSTEFLAAVLTIPQTSEGAVSISKDLVLKLCNNFVVFNTQLDTFRFAHLSGREFLEKRQEYTSIATNALAAEVCLWNLIYINPNPITKKFLSKRGQCLTEMSSKIEVFSEYSNVHWAVHCQLAGDERTSGKLKSIFRFFVSGEGGTACPIVLWGAGLPNGLRKLKIKRELQRRLEDTRVNLATASAMRTRD